MENVRNHRDIKIVTTNKQRNKLISEPNYHTTKYISKYLLIIEMKKTEVKMNRPIYLGQAKLDNSKILMYKLWYNYIKPKYGDRARLCYMDTDSFIIHIETEDFYKDIANDVEVSFDTCKYNEKDGRPLPIAKNKKELGFFKDELDGKLLTEFLALRAKVYAYLLEDGSEHKKAKETNKCIVKKEIKFKEYKESIYENKTVLKLQQGFRSYCHTFFTEEINKIALSNNDKKRLQTFDEITTYPRWYNAFMVCESKMLAKNKYKC